MHALPYKDREFDVVHAHQVLQHVADPVLALREMGRVAGLVAARDSDYGAFTWFPALPELDVGPGRHSRPPRWRFLIAWLTIR